MSEQQVPGWGGHRLINTRDSSFWNNRKTDNKRRQSKISNEERKVMQSNYKLDIMKESGGTREIGTKERGSLALPRGNKDNTTNNPKDSRSSQTNQSTGCTCKTQLTPTAVSGELL